MPSTLRGRSSATTWTRSCSPPTMPRRARATPRTCPGSRTWTRSRRTPRSGATSSTTGSWWVTCRCSGPRGGRVRGRGSCRSTRRSPRRSPGCSHRRRRRQCLRPLRRGSPDEAVRPIRRPPGPGLGQESFALEGTSGGSALVIYVWRDDNLIVAISGAGVLDAGRRRDARRPRARSHRRMNDRSTDATPSSVPVDRRRGLGSRPMEGTHPRVPVGEPGHRQLLGRAEPAARRPVPRHRRRGLRGLEPGACARAPGDGGAGLRRPVRRLARATSKTSPTTVELVEGDVRDQEAVWAAAQGCTTVFHLAATTSIERAALDPGTRTPSMPPARPTSYGCA